MNATSRAQSLIIMLVAATLIAACGEEATPPSETPAPAATPEVTATAGTPTSAAAPSARRVGIPEVDTVIDAVLSGDVETVRRVVRYTPIPCTVGPQRIGAPPECRPGEPDGTPVDVLPEAQCEGFYMRPDEVDRSLRGLVAGDLSLYAVYRAGSSGWPPGEYAAILLAELPEREASARRVVIEDGRVVGVDFGCGQTPEQIVHFWGLTEVVLPPAATPTTP